MEQDDRDGQQEADQHEAWAAHIIKDFCYLLKQRMYGGLIIKALNDDPEAEAVLWEIACLENEDKLMDFLIGSEQ